MRDETRDDRRDEARDEGRWDHRDDEPEGRDGADPWDEGAGSPWASAPADDGSGEGDEGDEVWVSPWAESWGSPPDEADDDEGPGARHYPQGIGGWDLEDEPDAGPPHGPTVAAGADRAGGGDAPPEFTGFRLGELWELPTPALRYVAEGLFPVGSLTLFAGREKEGKSLAMLDLAVSVAGGEDWAGHATTAGPVLYCPAEDSIRTVRDRLIRRLGPEHAADGRPLVVVPLSGASIVPGHAATRLDLNVPALVGALRRAVERERATLVILDCLRELHSARENESDDMTVTMRPLRQLAHELDVAVIVVHHASKGAGGSARGSTAIAAACDATAFWTASGDTADGAEPAPGTPLRATLMVRGRDVARTSVRMELGEDLRFRPALSPVAGMTPNAPKEQLSGARAQLVAVLSDGLWRTADELTMALKLPERTVENNLTWFMAQADARLERSRSGQRGDPFRYRLRARPLTADSAPTLLPLEDEPSAAERAAWWRE